MKIKITYSFLINFISENNFKEACQKLAAIMNCKDIEFREIGCMWANSIQRRSIQ